MVTGLTEKKIYLKKKGKRKEKRQERKRMEENKK